MISHVICGKFWDTKVFTDDNCIYLNHSNGVLLVAPEGIKDITNDLFPESPNHQGRHVFYLGAGEGFNIDLATNELYFCKSNIKDGKFGGINENHPGMSCIKNQPTWFQPYLYPGSYRTRNYFISKLPLINKEPKLFLPVNVLEECSAVRSNKSKSGFVIYKISTGQYRLIETSPGFKSVGMTLNETTIGFLCSTRSKTSITIMDNPLV